MTDAPSHKVESGAGTSSERELARALEFAASAFAVASRLQAETIQLREELERDPI